MKKTSVIHLAAVALDLLSQAGQGAALCVWLFCAITTLGSLKINAADPIPISELDLVSVRQGWGSLGTDCSVQGKPLRIGKQEFSHGLGTHANSEIVYDLEGRYETFESWVGVDAEMDYYGKSSVIFKVIVDGKEAFNSGVMRNETPAKKFSVSVKGAMELKLIASDAGDNINGDHADWAEAVLTGQVSQEEAAEIKYQVAAPGLVVQLDTLGRLAGCVAGPQKYFWALTGWTRLSGCRNQNPVEAKALAGGGYSFTRKVGDSLKHTATVVERFTPSTNSIHWEVEITSGDAPWTTAIATGLRCPNPRESLVWTAWSDPERKNDRWRDPLVLGAFTNRQYYYGNEAQSCPTEGDFIPIPLVTMASPATDAGVSLVLSPEDTLLNMNLALAAKGQAKFTRTCHRLGGGKTVRFAMDLVPHEADWRGGMRWIVSRYPQFFESKNALAAEMAGCGAYSGNENPIDVARFKRMAFRVNWKLSDDFPYMGMFIPPVADADTRWERSCDEKAAPGKTRWTSCRQLNDYARWMKTNGFYVLNYFNVTEYGKNMKDKPVPAERLNDPELWKDPVAYLKLRLPNGYFKPAIGTCYNAWVTDPGDPDYLQFMLDQAARHNRLVPDSFGICIDRMDWLRYYNASADDGVSWVNGKAARSCYQSWHNLMEKLGPLMHDAGKVIFVNSHTMRLELQRHVDGQYTEFGQAGSALNAAALLGVRMPVLAWNYNDTLKPDPDAFFQRHLHLGAYPTAPYPDNNHCITPDPWADQFYLDYGPLLDAMRGKKWVLTPHCVETATPGVKANLFEVPGGYALPVTFGGKAESAVVRVRNVPGLNDIKCVALRPGEQTPVTVPGTYRDGALELTVPLKRGCAMVQWVSARK